MHDRGTTTADASSTTNDPGTLEPVIDDVSEVGDGVFAVDTGYVRPRLDASHLVVADGVAAFVDTGPASAVPRLLAALGARDLEPAAVDAIVLTHVHLDHAGGAGALAASLPRARVIVHPRGVAHLVDPTQLEAATRAVYGDEAFERLYGGLVGVPAERIEIAEDGARLALGRRSYELLHTPGHALHHLCVFDSDTREVFTGDAFGVSYREFDTVAGAFVLAATTPSQFDPAQMLASIDRLLARRPSAAYLTHYSRVGTIDRLGADLKADVEALAAIARGAADDPMPRETIAARIYEHWSRRLDAHGYPADPQRRGALLRLDAELNAAGLWSWLTRARR